MDIEEFLVHLNLHLKMNLDYVFSSDLKEILKFFTAIEDFMEKTFGNKELEIKIDMMRLIVRMTNATYFIDKIYMLSQMNIKYLDYWQTFSLFSQVLMSELLTVEQKIKTSADRSTLGQSLKSSKLESIKEDSPGFAISSFASLSKDQLASKTRKAKGSLSMNLESSVSDLNGDYSDDAYFGGEKLRIKGDGSIDQRVTRPR
jgi:hypothetical protein